MKRWIPIIGVSTWYEKAFDAFLVSLALFLIYLLLNVDKLQLLMRLEIGFI